MVLLQQEEREEVDDALEGKEEGDIDWEEEGEGVEGDVGEEGTD